MKTLPSQLTPFVRSDAVGALLAETLGHPDAEFTLSALGRLTGVSGPVVHREVTRLVDAAVLQDRMEGRNRLVRANPEHPLYAPMREIIAATYGPVPVLRAAFDGVDGAEHVYIYGSWAARRGGEAGPFPNDVDVLVVGDVPRRTLSAIAGEASDQLAVPVNITRASREDWDAAEPPPFLRTVRSRPFVDVMTGAVHGG
ncbi:ArsR family transcriptional regulator [Microbacterium thalassium]|uniref:Putative nucleotidyltransferase n=1 Tax=Microbacterium thalassium TaxID=362649 RepID=A0A7X0FNE2_9MICO|nr:ArsR family transcriptional regulator [Microbacterium thalassium]MBB6390718.1 putative nucleotidyltransferase [Microbacterium thalassium]GLK25827.1 ArsR family transcriptional regulator [Microbacterium thalassium]